jgi:hypothetical protein
LGGPPFVSVRSARWILFLVFVFVWPWPMLGPFDLFAPVVRYVILFGASSLVAASEGAAGPVPLILLLFGLHAIVYLAIDWLAAWLLARSSRSLSGATRWRCVAAGATLAIALALLFDFYRTPFGRAPVANLLGVLS